jgi:asparagine synthase (glutamine-hydrolysing)
MPRRRLHAAHGAPVSGIAGIVNWDGRLVDPRMLPRLTDTLRGAGLNGHRVWLGGAVGFGHAAPRASRDAAAESQPLSLDGQTWITADARLDGRAELVRELTAHGCDGLRDASDAALILHAYHAWGESCVRNLLGDFAFAIWDGPRQRLYCARDHFGVKPLFYAQGADWLVFSNSLEYVRRYPGVSSALDDEAIADFLRSGGIRDPVRTAFADVRRLAAGHYLVGDGGVRARRYWTLPVDGEIRYRRGVEYVEQFADLLERAVGERVRGRDVGVLMSGGLDSTTVAATARRWLAREAGPFDLRAHTTVCDRVVADPERRYAQLAADALSLPIRYRVVDDYRVFERWDKAELHRWEPEADPLLALHVDQLSDAAASAPVLLTGYGADPAVRLPVSYAIDLVRRGEVRRLTAELASYVFHCRRLPRVRLSVHARRCLGLDRRTVETTPRWLRPEFREPSTPAPSLAMPSIHPTRPHAYELLTSPDWPQIFESYHPAVTGIPVEVRHPFFDRRLVEYLLAIPPMPWCFDKTLIRLAMRGTLPEATRRRPKTVAAGDPLVALLQAPDAQWVDDFVPTPQLQRYVDRNRIPRVCGERDPGAIWSNLRPLCLNYWLQSQSAS